MRLAFGLASSLVRRSRPASSRRLVARALFTAVALAMLAPALASAQVAAPANFARRVLEVVDIQGASGAAVDSGWVRTEHCANGLFFIVHNTGSVPSSAPVLTYQRKDGSTYPSPTASAAVGAGAAAFIGASAAGAVAKLTVAAVASSTIRITAVCILSSVR